jgi:hypothetical protein
MSVGDWAFAKSHRFQIIAVAVLSTGITAAAILGSQHIRRQIRIQKLKESVAEGEEHNVSLFL